MKPVRTIMIVDDDDVFVFLTKKAIDKLDLFDQLIIFDNGLDAINYLKENIERIDLMPDIILLDLSVPIMDGWQFLDEFVLLSPKMGRKIIIYIVSSSISPNDIRRAANIDVVSDYIIKPVTKDQLTEIMKNR